MIRLMMVIFTAQAATARSTKVAIDVVGTSTSSRSTLLRSSRPTTCTIPSTPTIDMRTLDIAVHIRIGIVTRLNDIDNSWHGECDQGVVHGRAVVGGVDEVCWRCC